MAKATEKIEIIERPSAAHVALLILEIEKTGTKGDAADIKAKELITRAEKVLNG